MDGVADGVARNFSSAITWHLFKKVGAPDKFTKDLSKTIDAESPRRIRCPRCAWQPGASDRWVCWSGDGPEPPFEACGTAWHTFATRGKCPGCSHQWRWTSCLQCNEWSPHEDWYEEVD